jgi:hypothetical protein
MTLNQFKEWPPKLEDGSDAGENGIFRSHSSRGANYIDLKIEYDGKERSATLTIEDPLVRDKATVVLATNKDRTIRDIGQMNITP